MNKIIKVINSISHPHIVFTLSQMMMSKKKKKKSPLLTEYTVTLGKLFKPKMHKERTKNPVTNPKV